jgi:AmmeMemoRadiSam system protein A
MTSEERATLLTYARRCVEAVARGGDPPALERPPPALAAQGAAFVTLRSKGELRGCIGHVQAVKPLWESVREMAEAAASRDPRFSPVAAGEPIEIEISVISPMTPIRPEAIRVGTHGLYVRRGGLSGLLLPQVAVEWAWDAVRFLEQTCKKADLPLDAWRDPAVEILAFTAEVLHEVQSAP